MAKQIDLTDGGTVTRAWGGDGWFWEFHDNQGRRIALFRMTEGERARLAGLLLSTMEHPNIIIDEDESITSVTVTVRR